MRLSHMKLLVSNYCWMAPTHSYTHTRTHRAHHFSVPVHLGSDCLFPVMVSAFKNRPFLAQTKQNMSCDTNWPEVCVSDQCCETEYVFPSEYYDLYQSTQPRYRGFLNWSCWGRGLPSPTLQHRKSRENSKWKSQILF